MNDGATKDQASARFVKYYLLLPWRQKLTQEDRAQYEKAFKDAKSGKYGIWLFLLSFINYTFLIRY